MQGMAERRRDRGEQQRGEEAADHREERDRDGDHEQQQEGAPESLDREARLAHRRSPRPGRNQGRF